MLSGWIPIALLFASGTVGQTFTELLRSHDHLSHWYRLIKPFWAELDAMTNVTIFVPNNDGVAAYFNTPQSEGCLSTDLDVLRATIDYHMTAGSTSTVLTDGYYHWYTYLSDVAYSPDSDNNTWFITYPPHIYASSGQPSRLTGESWAFQGGHVYVIDGVMQLPMATIPLLLANGLDEAAALFSHTQTSDVLDYRGLGMFAPTNDAIHAAGTGLQDLTSDRLTSLAEYHLFNGSNMAAYTSLNDKILTLLGENVTFKAYDNHTNLYVNNAWVIFLRSWRGKTVHLYTINQFLNPENTTVPRNASAWPGGKPIDSLGEQFDMLPRTSVPLCKNPLISNNRKRTATVVGGIVGGVVALCLLAGGFWFLKRRQKFASQSDNKLALKSELDGDRPRTELPVDEKGELSAESQKHELRGIHVQEMWADPIRKTSELPAYKSATEYTPEIGVTSPRDENKQADVIEVSLDSDSVSGPSKSNTLDTLVSAPTAIPSRSISSASTKLVTPTADNVTITEPSSMTESPRAITPDPTVVFAPTTVSGSPEET